MHVFATNESFLKLYYDEAVAMIEEVDIKTAEKFLFYVIFPDNRGVTPLETALREHAPKCVEIMLEMLRLRPHYLFSKYLRKHFYELLDMQSLSFDNYLETCTFKIN